MMEGSLLKVSGKPALITASKSCPGGVLVAMYVVYVGAEADQ